MQIVRKYTYDSNFLSSDNIDLKNQGFRQTFVNDWFHENFVVLNPRKCHFMWIGNVDETNLTLISQSLKNSAENKLQRSYKDNLQKFKSKVKRIVLSYIKNETKKLLCNSMIKPQFNCRLLLWMIYLTQSNNLINKERFVKQWVVSKSWETMTLKGY